MLKHEDENKQTLEAVGINLNHSEITHIGSSIDEDNVLPLSPQISEDQQKRYQNKTQIFTPTFWTNNEYENRITCPWQTKYKIMKEQHFRCEVLEKRINQKKIENIMHNALVPSLEKHCDDLEIASEEKVFYNHYQYQKESNTKPTFWPSRIYDESYLILDEEGTGILVDQINEIEKPVPIEEFEEMRDKSRRKKKIERPENKRHCVPFSALDYATEDDDDLTQWSDAEL